MTTASAWQLANKLTAAALPQARTQWQRAVNNAGAWCLSSLIVIVGIPSLLHAQATWTSGVSSSWSVIGNWNPNNVPDNSGEDATITFGAPALDAVLTIRNLYLKDAQIVGAPLKSLHVSGNLTWTNAQFSADAEVQIDGASALSGTLGNFGTLTFSNSTVTSGAGLALENHSVMNLSSNTSLSGDSSGLFTNSGTLGKSSGDTSINIPISNTGTIVVSGGNLTLSRGASSGTLLVQSGGTLRIAGSDVNPFDLAAGYINNSGTLMNSGFLKATAAGLNGRALIMDSAITPELYLSGDFSTASFTWNSGIISGPGVTTTSGITWSNDKRWGVGNGRTLENSGAIDWNNGVWGQTSDAVGVIGTTSAGTISNLVSGNFNINFDAAFGLPNHPDLLTVENHGAFNVGAGKSAAVYGAMNSDGSITVNDGPTLTLAGGGTNSGTITVGNNALLVVSGANDPQTYTFSTTARVKSSAASSLAIFANSTSSFAGTVGNDINLQIGRSIGSSASLTVQSAASFSPKTITVHSGLFELANGAAASTATMSVGVSGGDQSQIILIGSGATLTTTHYTQAGDSQLDLQGGRLVATSAATFSGLIQGSGTIESPSSSIAALVLPGAENIGAIHFAGDLSFAIQSDLEITIDSDSKAADRVEGNGAIHLGGDGGENGATLFVVVMGASQISANDRFVIVQAGSNGRDGKFTNARSGFKIPQAGRIFAYADSPEPVGSFEVEYTSDQVALTHFAVPEPGALGVVIMAGLLLQRRRRSGLPRLP